MTKLKNFLRCYAMGMGIKSIANTFQISRNTVRKYVRRYQAYTDYLELYPSEYSIFCIQNYKKH